MLSQQEVYEIMKKDILNLQRKRITELEKALAHTSSLLDAPIYGKEISEIVASNKALIEKGISL